MSPSQVQAEDKRGWIIPVGGAEDKLRDAAILRRFLSLSGDDGARIAVIPTASKLETLLESGVIHLFRCYTSTNTLRP